MDADLASAPRRRVLDAVLAAEAGIDAQTLADGLGLHVTTARFHLDQLERAGLARRRSESDGRRGRPRLLYTAAGSARADDAREQLIAVLAAALSAEPDAADAAVAAGRRWADAMPPAPAADPVDRLSAVLDRLGFEPEADADLIRLHGCPFRESARQNPRVVCSVHRGLVQRLLAPLGEDAELVPFAEPELCLVRLPARTATA